MRIFLCEQIRKVELAHHGQGEEEQQWQQHCRKGIRIWTIGKKAGSGNSCTVWLPQGITGRRTGCWRNIRPGAAGMMM